MKTSLSASIPNPTLLLFLLTAAAFLLWPDAAGITALIVALVILVPLVMAGLVRRPAFAIAAVVAASAVPRLFVNIMGLKARPEHLIGGLLLLALPFLWKARSQPVHWITADYCLLAYIALIFFSSMMMSVAPAQTTKWGMQQVLAILPYFFLRVLITDRKRFRWAFQCLLVIGAVVCGYAIVALYAHLLFGTSFGMDLEQYGDMPATYGLQYEPNILGAYSAALAIMLLVLYLHERDRKYLIGYAGFGLVSLAVSLSRAALGAAVVGIGVVAIVAFRRKLINRQVAFRVLAATLCAFVLVAPVFLPFYTQRFETIDISDPTADPNTVTRAVQVLSALDEVEKHPVFGGGVASFQLAFDWQTFGTEWEDQGWIGNTELRVLHDTGVVGLIVFLAFLFSLARQSVKQLKRAFSPELLALLCSGVVYSITFQATEGTLLAFPWVQLGLIGCAVSVMRQEETYDPLAEPASA